MCRASSDDDNENEFSFDNLFVSHLDILGYAVRRTKGSVTLTDRKCANRTREHAAPRYDSLS